MFEAGIKRVYDPMVDGIHAFGCDDLSFGGAV